MRLLRVLVEHLPPDSATARAEVGHAWCTEHWQLADLTDHVANLLVATLNAHRSEKAPAVPWPEPVWRPGDPTPKQKAAAERRRQREQRAAYREIVAQVAPGR